MHAGQELADRTNSWIRPPQAILIKEITKRAYKINAPKTLKS